MKECTCPDTFTPDEYNEHHHTCDLFVIDPRLFDPNYVLPEGVIVIEGGTGKMYKCQLHPNTQKLIDEETQRLIEKGIISK